jgi:DNA invertase Pin-like site-specific DNA recombinase
MKNPNQIAAAIKADIAAIYGRVSTNQQTTAAQESRAKDYIKFKWGDAAVVNAVEFYDDDTSGTIPIWDRPKGRQLRARLLLGDVKHVVVAKLDRLGRSAIDLLNTVKMFDSLGVILHIVDLGGDSLSTQGASGRLMFTVLAGMAEYERALIAGRIEAKFEVKRDKGELCGTESYGWSSVETGEVTPKGVKIRRLVDNPEEQKWILVMFQLRRTGMGYHSIAKYLNSQGVPTKRGKGIVMKLRTADRSIAKWEEKPTSGKWQSGNVSGVLDPENVTVQNWMHQQLTQIAA